MGDDKFALVKRDLDLINLDEIPDFGHKEILEAEQHLSYLHREAAKAGVATAGLVGVGLICLLSLPSVWTGFGLLFVMLLMGGLSVATGAATGTDFAINLIRIIKQSQHVNPKDLKLARLAADVRQRAIEWNGARKSLSDAIVGLGESARPEESKMVVRTAIGLAEQRRQLEKLIECLRSARLPESP